MNSSSQRYRQTAYDPYPTPSTHGLLTRIHPLSRPASGTYHPAPLKPRRNTVHYSPETKPIGMAAPRSTTRTETDVALQYSQATEFEIHDKLSRVFEENMPPTVGPQTSPIKPVTSPFALQAHRGSRSARITTPYDVPSLSGCIRVPGRPRRRDTNDNVTAMPHHASDQPSHIVLASTPAVTQGNMETNDYWDGGQQLGLNVPENTVAPETRPVQHLYPHDTGRTDRACHPTPPEGPGAGRTPGVHENPIGADMGTATGLFSSVNSFPQAPVSTISDQRTSGVNAGGQNHTAELQYPTQYFSSAQDCPTPPQPAHIPHSSPPFYLPAAAYENQLMDPILILQSPPMSVPFRYTWEHPVSPMHPQSLNVTDVGKAVDLCAATYTPVHQLPFDPTSPLVAASPPSDISNEDRPLSSVRCTIPQRHPGQRVDVDQAFLDSSFNDADELSRRRRAILNDIQRQPWFLNHEKEPQIESRTDSFSRGLGTVGRSIYTVFLREDKENNQWRCLFGGKNNACKKAGKRFERVERAIEHIRSHLGHRPFACDGTCMKSMTTNASCGKRFFAAGYLEDHKKRPQKRTRNSPY